MVRYSGSLIVACIFAAGAASAPGCSGSPDEPGLDESFHGGHDDDGEELFEEETFDGNGRTCATCHPSDSHKSGTINPAEVSSRFSRNRNDPLFRHDGADVIGGNTFNRIRQHATILIDMPLPSNVRILGSSARNVILPRGVPTTMNTPALDPVLMYDGRHPNLQVQALSAVRAHAQGDDPTAQELDDIAEFQQDLFNRDNVKKLAQNGTTPKMPKGITASQKRGRRWFISDNQTDPDQAGEGDGSGLGFEFCGFCHSNDMLNETSAFLGLPDVEPGIPAGTRMMNILVSEFNVIGNPVYDFEFTKSDGSVVVVRTPDPGLALITGNPDDAVFLGSGTAKPSSFKIPTVWGIKDTAPYFHDNSAKTLEDVVRHYQQAAPTLTGGFVAITDQDVIDIAAYMRLL